MNKKDIQGREEFHHLMSSFYERAMKDELLGSKFEGIDMETHIPRIVEFWMSIIFYSGNFKGSPFDKHVHLELERQHFDRWLALFEVTLTEFYEGPNTNEVLKRAQSIAKIFLHKIEGLSSLS